MRFHFIQAERANHSVRRLCRSLEVSRAGFYEWLNRAPSARAAEDARLLAKIRRVHIENRKRYGSPRVHAELVQQGESVGRHRVARLMAQNGLRAQRKRRRHPKSQSRHHERLAPNRLNRAFAVSKADRVWATDVTAIWTYEGWLYLAVVLDLFSRRVVGWSMAKTKDQRTVVSAMQMAIEHRSPQPGLPVHSDREGQYSATAFSDLLKSIGAQQSMSRSGNCWDNAVVESFFSSMKNELVYREELRSRRAAQQKVFEYIELYYNRRRCHSYLGYLSPVAYEELNEVA